jgi:hypothetical protein
MSEGRAVGLTFFQFRFKWSRILDKYDIYSVYATGIVLLCIQTVIHVVLVKLEKKFLRVSLVYERISPVLIANDWSPSAERP